MEKNLITLPSAIREIAGKYFVMLERHPGNKRRDSLEIQLNGYSDLMFIIANITKVCILALDSEESHPGIPQPVVNISGVLGIILDLLPYDEANLLDHIRDAVLYPEDDQLYESEIFLVMPEGLRVELENPN